MTRKIFKGIFLVSCITLLASAVLIMGVLYNYFSDELNNRLISEAEYVSSGVETGGIDYLNDLRITDKSRVTWIAEDGTVLFDSRSDISKMKNHSDREEFVEAMQTGTGTATRYSDTLAENTVYRAVLLSDASVIRVSADQATIWSLILGILQPAIVVIVVAIILSIVLSNLTSRKILKPINNIDLNNPDIDEKYDEFAPLLNKINTQNQMIQKQMEDLRRQRDEFGIITENMTEGLLIIDDKTELLSYNSSALRLLGAKAPDGKVSILSLNRNESFIRAVEKSLTGEHTIQNLFAGEKCCQIIANPVYANNKVSGAIIVLIDITETEKREKLRREFTSNVSHELKTPLTSIYGMSEILMSGMVKETDISDFAGSIHDESGRLISMINDILKLSQLDESNLFNQKEAVDLYEISKSVVERLKPVAEKAGISLRLKGEPSVIKGVPTVLDEIVYNLCENGIKYNKPEGSVRILVSDKGHGHCQLIVEDTGIGIPSEDQDRVFERFYRVDKSHSRTIGGTGLGLSIVKHGAACHDASISLDSTEGVGTRIKISF